jgi:hypothetical protein
MLMNFRRQMQARLAGWQAQKVILQLYRGFGLLGKILRGMSFNAPLHLTPYECPAPAGGVLN